MKQLLLLILIAVSFGAAAAPPAAAADNGVVCVDGMCYLPGTEPPAVKPAAIPLPVTEQYTVLRRGIGMMNKDDFRTFLLGTEKTVPMHFWGVLLLAIVGGFLLNLTPCVLPMLPINLAVIGANGGKNGLQRGLIYGLGMATAYGVLGILVSFAGLSFGAVNSSPVFNFAIGLLFIIMAVAMTGKINFDLSRLLPNFGGKLQTASALWIFAAGALAALLAGACVAPAVVSVLVYTTSAVADGKWYAVVVPFALGIGMALPWPLAGKGMAILPKPGKFMVTVKYLFALLIFGAGAFYIMQGIKLNSAPQITAHGNGFDALAAARQQAVQENKPLLVKFTASWCKNCAAMERDALADNEIRELIKNRFIMVTFPAENPNEPAIASLLKSWEIPGFPAFVILKPVNPKK